MYSWKYIRSSRINCEPACVPCITCNIIPQFCLWISNSVCAFLTCPFLSSRNYVNSNYCLEEFQLAHHQMVNEDKRYLMAVLLEPLDMNSLPRDLQMYLRTYTYIDATKHPRNLALYDTFETFLY